MRSAFSTRFLARRLFCCLHFRKGDKCPRIIVHDNSVSSVVVPPCNFSLSVNLSAEEISFRVIFALAASPHAVPPSFSQPWFIYETNFLRVNCFSAVARLKVYLAVTLLSNYIGVKYPGVSRYDITISERGGNK